MQKAAPREVAKSGADLRRTFRTIDRLLESRYGPRRQKGHPEPLDALVMTILSQNTNDKNSGQAYQAMRAEFPTWESVMNAPAHELERVLRPGGLAATKSRRIRAILRSIAKRGPITLRHLRDLPTDRAERELTAYPGVGYKTARCVLLFSLGRDVFPIDTHIFRILSRVGLIDGDASRDNAHRAIPQYLPAGRSYPLHMNLIALGRDLCKPRNPECSLCPLRRLCAFARSRLR